jgi:protein-disulfide isomerase
MVRVEVQYFRGCPNSDEMIRRVKEAIRDLDGVEYNEVLIETEELARKYGFRGSPTLLINGKDFEGMPIPPLASLSCRVYIKGLPTIAQIREKISSILENK